MGSVDQPAMVGSLKHGGGSLPQVATSVAFGCGATGMFRALDQLTPTLQGALWLPAVEVNALLGRLMGWPPDTTLQHPLGWWIQEGVIFLAVTLVVLWFSRRGYVDVPAEKPALGLALTAMVLGPWLTNAEAVVIAVSTSVSAQEAAVVLFCLVGCIAAVAGAAQLTLRGYSGSGGLLFLVAFVFGGGFVFWLNSPVAAPLQLASMLCSCVLFAAIVGQARTIRRGTD